MNHQVIMLLSEVIKNLFNLSDDYNEKMVSIGCRIEALHERFSMECL